MLCLMTRIGETIFIGDYITIKFIKIVPGRVYKNLPFKAILDIKNRKDEFTWYMPFNETYKINKDVKFFIVQSSSKNQIKFYIDASPHIKILREKLVNNEQSTC